jgi:hypothetical protein
LASFGISPAITLFLVFILTSCKVSQPAPVVTLALLGDVMLGRAVHATSETFAYLEPYSSSADLVLANLESPLTAEPVLICWPLPTIIALTVGSKDCWKHSPLSRTMD